MKLTDYLKREGLTQVEFGLRLDPPMSQAALSHVVNGRIRISLERALEIQAVTDGAVAVTDWVRPKGAPGAAHGEEPSGASEHREAA